MTISNVLLNSKILMLDDDNLRDNTLRMSPNITLLNLSNNSLSLIFDQVYSLVLHNNSINSSISNVLLNFKVLMLSYNNLRSNVPRILLNVTPLYLSNNSLSRTISHFLCYKTKKIEIAISNRMG
ncbi:hypothetical protein Ahy_A09g046000 isoform B [Arachis hypogaea]|uniref:LRR receptor-like serine/threonine-protein kinase n=1 Tax=Arachis hypogaea TaxID=3818 RepID=A0A445BNM3_ARAHY|nr:hypothetical protein Ahy_A09g046000 isoform B [Arachis hypogaea]